MFNFRPISF